MPFSIFPVCFLGLIEYLFLPRRNFYVLFWIRLNLFGIDCTDSHIPGLKGESLFLDLVVFGLGDGLDVEGRRVEGFPVVGLGDGLDVDGRRVDGVPVVGLEDGFDVGDEDGHMKLICVALRCRYAFAVR